MTVAYSSSEGFPLLCILYTCGCGRKEVQYGRQAGELPRGWIAVPGDGEPRVACPDCAPKAAAAAARTRERRGTDEELEHPRDVEI